MPRSGTTLLAKLLGSHSEISCGAETHFFPYLEANSQRVSSIIEDTAWPTRATKFMSALNLDDYLVHDLFGITAEDIFDYLATRQPSVTALLESLTVPQMLAQQKTRWAEKTPNHLLHLAAVRKLYPAAKIVRILRDPRDAAISMAAKLPWTSNSPVDCAYLINEWYYKSHPFFEQDHLSYTLKYEELVTRPEKCLQELCDFLQISFEAKMLNTQKAAQQTAPSHEIWKTQVGQKLDQSRCLAWQKQDCDRTIQAISMICQDMIQQFGYLSVDSPLEPIYSHYISDRFVRCMEMPSGQLPSQQIEQLLCRGYVLVPCNPRAMTGSSQIVYCDVPMSGRNWGKNLQRFYRFWVDLIAARWQGITIKFTDFCQISLPECSRFRGMGAFLLRLLGSRTNLIDLVASDRNL